jgi:hypothetical protein
MFLSLSINCEMDLALILSLQRLDFRPVRFHVKLVEAERQWEKFYLRVLPFFLAVCPTIDPYSCFIQAP